MLWIHRSIFRSPWDHSHYDEYSLSFYLRRVKWALSILEYKKLLLTSSLHGTQQLETAFKNYYLIIPYMYMIYLGHFHLLLPFLIPLSLLLYPFFLTSPHPIFMGFFFWWPSAFNYVCLHKHGWGLFIGPWAPYQWLNH